MFHRPAFCTQRLQIVQSKLTLGAGGAESGPGIGPKHRDVAGITTERTDLEGRCRLAGVINDSNHDDFSTQIMISKFRPSIFIDFRRFSSILKIDDRKYYCINLIYSSKKTKNCVTNIQTVSENSGMSWMFVRQIFVYRFHFCCSNLAKMRFLRKSMKIDENR